MPSTLTIDGLLLVVFLLFSGGLVHESKYSYFSSDPVPVDDRLLPAVLSPVSSPVVALVDDTIGVIIDAAGVTELIVTPPRGVVDGAFVSALAAEAFPFPSWRV